MWGDGVGWRKLLWGSHTVTISSRCSVKWRWGGAVDIFTVNPVGRVWKVMWSVGRRPSIDQGGAHLDGITSQDLEFMMRKKSIDLRRVHVTSSPPPTHLKWCLKPVQRVLDTFVHQEPVVSVHHQTLVELVLWAGSKVWNADNVSHRMPFYSKYGLLPMLSINVLFVIECVNGKKTFAR